MKVYWIFTRAISLQDMLAILCTKEFKRASWSKRTAVRAEGLQAVACLVPGQIYLSDSVLHKEINLMKVYINTGINNNIFE